MNRLIGILGGTFDPIHYGHLCPVHQLASRLEFRRVHYVLSARPPHRSLPVASVTHRYNMLSLALEAYPQFIPDDQEILRPGPSFTIWSVRKLRQRYPDDCLCLIVGVDAYLDLHKWFRWQDILTLANIVVLPRPGWQSGQRDELVGVENLNKSSGGAVVCAGLREMPITATEIRKKLQRGEEVSGEMPDSVLTYIHKNQIYGTQECYE